MLKDIFKKRKYVTVQSGKKEAENKSQRLDIPEGLWQKCPNCAEILYSKDLEKNLNICHKCEYHFRLGAKQRIQFTVDAGSFVELDSHLVSKNPLLFPNYEEKLASAIEKTNLQEAVVTGQATIGGFPVVIATMDTNFIMASMGTVVGEKIVRAMEKAVELKIPFIIFAASGGARMQEGILSLMQMAKTCGAVSKMNEAGILYISVFTDPTTGGVTASFASLGDINIAEPGALIGFTGPRVIEQTIRQKLPEGFQRAEFMMKHGFVDMIVPRLDMAATLAKILSLHQVKEAQVNE